MTDVSHAPRVSLWVSVEASKLKPPLWPSAQQTGGSWARTRQGRRCELAFLTHARPTSASEPFFCVFACVCVCFLSSPLWPALTPTSTHSLQHYTKHSCSLLLSITSIALECTSSFCFSLFFMIIHCDSLKNCEENKGKECLENTPCSSFLLAVGKKTNVYLFLSSALPSSLALHNSWAGDEEAFSVRHDGVHIMRLNCCRFGAWNDLLTLSKRLITEFNSWNICRPVFQLLPPLPFPLVKKNQLGNFSVVSAGTLHALLQPAQLKLWEACWLLFLT